MMFNSVNPYVIGASTLGGFLPTDIGGIVLWLRSDLGITKDGSDLVSGWADQSGVGNNALQGTETYKPLWVDTQINGYASVNFNGSDNYMVADSIASTFSGSDTPVTVFWVSKRTAAGDDVYPWTVSVTGAVAPFFGAWNYSNQFGVRRRGDDSAIVAVQTGSIDANWNYWIMNFHGTTISLIKNGVTVIDAAAMDTDVMTGLNGFTLGALQYNSTVTGFADVNLAEIGAYNSDVADVSSLVTYLATRYGL